MKHLKTYEKFDFGKVKNFFRKKQKIQEEPDIKVIQDLLDSDLYDTEVSIQKIEEVLYRCDDKGVININLSKYDISIDDTDFLKKLR